MPYQGDSLGPLDTHLQGKIFINEKNFICKNVRAYIGSILHEDHQPSLMDIDKQACDWQWSSVHSFHMDHASNMDPNIDFLCRPCYLDIQDLFDIRLGKLLKRNYE